MAFRTFVQALMSGEAVFDDMWKWESAWQESYTHVSLCTWLGLSEYELAAVREDSGLLRFVVEARRAGVETGFPVRPDRAVDS